jgi:hypothetical protein
VFRGLGASGTNIITFAAGALIDGGSLVRLSGENISFLASAALMTPSAKVVHIVLSRYSRVQRTANVTLFSTTATTNTISLDNSMITGNFALPMLYLGTTGQGVTAILAGFGASGLSFGTGTIGGVAGATVGFLASAFYGRAFNSTALVSPVVATTNTFVAPSTTIAARPAMIADTAKGTLQYNSDTREWEYWDGAVWRSMPAPKVGADLASATSVALVERIHAITGSAAIATLALPWTGFTGDATLLVPAGATWTLVTGGNIAAALSPAAGTSVKVTYNGTAWYPAS